MPAMLLLAWVLAVSLALTGAARAEEVMLFAAASLTDALREIAPAYEAASGDTVAFNFGASSDLARQIEAGAPADVFFSADVAQMAGLEAAGLVSRAARHDVLSNVLAIVVPKASATVIRDPGDLARVDHVAIADPEAVPAGVYARRWLESLGLWERIAPRVVPTLDVRAALAAVAAEHADAGVVYRTDATLSPAVRVAYAVPREQGPAIVYPLAPIAGSKKRGTAALVRHLVSPAAQKAYERYGFVVILGR